MLYSVSELISYFGGMLGIVLSIVLLTKAKGAASVRISFASYLITGSLMIILGAMIYSGKILSFPHLLRVDSPIHYLFPPLGFFFVYSVFKPGFKFRWIHLLNFLPFLLNLAEFTPFYLEDATFKTDYYNKYVTTHGSWAMPLHMFAKTVNALIYFGLQVFAFFRYRPKETDNSVIPSSTVIWFWIFLAGQAIMLGGLFADQLTSLNFDIDPYRFSITMVTFFIYDIVLALLFFPEMLYGNQVSPVIIPLIKEKYVWSKLTAGEKSTIMDRVTEYLMDKGKPFVNPKLSLQDASLVLNINPNRLSQVINEKTGLNFKDYINSYRVEEAKLLLSSQEFQKLTIEAIAEKAGFNSKSPFYAAFKKHTGMTPKEFVALQFSQH
ncbi:MAG: AraC family transcriptional regulator [Lentimicrobium sp.]|nr:AraC family transcriptional regulator [Lentimicrobium sp.]